MNNFSGFLVMLVIVKGARMKCLKSCASLMVMLPSLLMAPSDVHAAIALSGTRFVYPMQEKEITVTADNHGKRPVLIRAWIDNGDVQASPETIKVPFVLSPPLARVNPEQSQLLRLSYVGDAQLPTDRESLFWLNVHEVPPKPNAKHEEGTPKSELNTIQLAFRYRVKVFLRPAGLKGTAEQAAAALVWSINPVGSPDSSPRLTARNDQPYYVSLAAIKLTNGVQAIDALPDTVAPFSSETFALKAPLVTGDAKWSVNYTSINEWGGMVTNKKAVGALSPATRR